MNASTSRRLVRAMIGAAGLAAALPAQGQLVSWVAADGLWSTPTNWNPAGVPNSSTALVAISAAGTYTVGIDVSPSVGSLTLSNATGKAAIYNGRTLYVQGSGGISNDSTLTVNPTSETSGTAMRFDVDAPLTGTGEIVLNANPSNLDTAYISSLGGSLITMSAGHTIRGTGRIMAPMNNAGTIVADRTGRVLELASGAKANTGMIGAAGGGALAVNTSVAQSGLGTIQADGGSVDIGAVTISGGQIEVKNLGLVRTYSSTLESVVAAGLIDIPNGNSLFVAGNGLTHNGTLTVNPTAEGSGTRLHYNVAAPLAGDGTVVLNANPANLDTAYISSLGGSLITLSAAHTIRGTGNIYAPMTNNGTIIADRNGLVLRFLSASKTNNNLITATGGAVLDFFAISITQSPTSSIVANGGTTRVIDSTVSGGRISAIGGGLTQVFGGTFNDVAVDGPLQVRNGHTLIVTGTALTNNGTITINPTAESSGTQLRYDSTALLTGTGSIILNANSASLDTAYINTTGVVCTLDVNQVIRGTGRIFASLINNGTIAADVQGRTMELLGSAKTNNALISASGGSTLWINSALSQGATGVVRVEDSTLGVGGITITGGQINATGTGLVQVYNSTLDTVVSSAPIEVPNGYSMYVAGTGFTHNGTITVNPTEGASGTQIRFDATIPMNGTGEIILAAHPANVDTSVLQTSGTNIVTLPATRTVRGTGAIYGAVINNGLIVADRSGRILSLRAASKTNNATMKATNGGTLLVSTNVTNTQGQFVADGGNIAFEGATVTGGQMHAANGGGVTTYGSTLIDVTSDAAILVPNGFTLTIQGAGFTNNGSVTINPTAAGAGTALRFEPSGVLAGTGQVILNANQANLDTALVYSTSVNPVTVGPAQVVRGRGRMLGNFILQGSIAPGFVGGPTARVQADSGSITMTPTASIDIDIAGSGGGQWDQITGNNSITLSGTLNVSFGYTPTGNESFDLVTGSGITGRFSAVNITGAPSSGMSVVYTPTVVRLVSCYANCDASSGSPLLTANDFMCFINRFVAGDPWANCDQSSGTPALTANDFVCFINAYAAGCS